MDESRQLRPGGRTAQTRLRVHEAVRALLHDDPDQTPKIAQIARRSGVNAATIHRRWGSVEAVLLDTLVAEVNATSPPPATGDLRADLLAFGHQVIAGVSAPGGLHFVQAIAAAAASDGNQAAAALMEDRIVAIEALLNSASATSLTAGDVIDGVIAPIYFRRMLTADLAISDGDLERLVDKLIGLDGLDLRR